MRQYRINDFEEAKKWLEEADAVLLTASNGLSISEGYHIFADNADFKKYFGKFREKYGIDCLIRGVFATMPGEEHAEYMKTVHRYMIEDYQGSEVMKNLLGIVRERPYFVVTCNCDTHFQLNGFDAERIFEVEGNFDGLEEHSDAWKEQQRRFSAFVGEYADAKVVLLELGIGSRNQLIKAPMMELAAGQSSWSYISMNMPQEIYIPESLCSRAVALTGDIAQNLQRL